LSQCTRTDIPGILFTVYENWRCPHISNGIGRSSKGHGLTEYLVARTDVQHDKSQMKGCSTSTRYCYMRSVSKIFFQIRLKTINIRTKRCHPVVSKCLVDIL